MNETCNEAISESYNEALEKAQAWYGEVNYTVRGILEDIFGNEVTTYRVKRFDDALKRLGKTHPLVKAYNSLMACDTSLIRHEIVGMQLRIISAAMNDTSNKDGNWVPVFKKMKHLDKGYKEDEYLYKVDTQTYFVFDGCLELVLEAPTATDVLLYSFKDKDAAKYAGKQFIAYWCEYIMGR